MTRKTGKSSSALDIPARALEAAAKPAEMVGQAVERALDPLASAIKRAALKRAQKSSETPPPAGASAPTTPGKPGLLVSPLAVPFPEIAPVAGVEIATVRAGFYRHEHDDCCMRCNVGVIC